MNSSNSTEDFVADDFEPEQAPAADDFVQDDFEPDQEAKPERSTLAKTGRVLGQYGLGVLEGTVPAIAYDVTQAIARSPNYQVSEQRHLLAEEMQGLNEKNYGIPFEEWDDADKESYKFIKETFNNPEKIRKEVEEKQADLSIRGLVGKATGVNAHPEGWAEKVANWMGFIRRPQGLKSLKALELTPKEVAKAILPHGTEIARGVAAGTALQMAENGQWGPVGTIAAAVTGDILGHAPKATAAIIRNPQAAAAHAINLLTLNNTKRLVQTQLAEDFAKSNIPIDAGTLSGSPIVKWVQARLSQSGLTGEALDNFRKELSASITNEYSKILEDMGEIKFENSFQAGEAINRALKTEEVALNTPKNLEQQAKDAASLEGRVAVQDRPDYQQTLLDRIAPEETRNSYQGGENIKTAAEDIKGPIKEEFEHRWSDFNNEVDQIRAAPQGQLVRQLDDFIAANEGSLLLGESAAEHRVLTAAQRLRNQLATQEGGLIGVSMGDLIKTKRTLGDVANWEFGGSNFESAYKRLVADIDEAVQRGLAENQELRNTFMNLNADYEMFKTNFENPNLKKVFEPKNHNYNTIYQDFVKSPDKLRALEDIFHNSERGNQLINQIKRDYAREVTSKPNVTARELEDLRQVLGPQYDSAVLDFMQQRQHAIENPLPLVQRGERLGLEVPRAETTGGRTLSERRITETGTPSAQKGLKKKLAEKLQGKTPEQVYKQMDTIEGIRELKKALGNTPEGKELFKELSRFKVAQIIDNNMSDAINGSVKLTKFSKFINPSNRSLFKELLGEDIVSKLELLQKNSGKLAESAAKFFNASQSGTTFADVAVVGSAMSGLFSLNPWMFAPAVIKIGGSKILANLLASPKFLNEFQKAIRTSYPEAIKEFVKNVKPLLIAAQASKDEVERKEE